MREKQKKQQVPFKSVGVTGRKNLGPSDGASPRAVQKGFTEFRLLGVKENFY